MSEKEGQNNNENYEQSYAQEDQNTENYNYGQYDNVNPNITAWGTTLYDYAAQSEAELSFTSGETIGIIEDLGDGWSRGDLNGVEGIFPTNYVELYNNDQYYQERNAEYSANDLESEHQTGLDSQGKKVDEEVLKKRREKREQLKGEMKDLKTELEKNIVRREKLENELNEITQQKQKLRTDVSRTKAELSNRQSILFDIISLYQTIELHSDACVQQQSHTQLASNDLFLFGNELQKEAKSIPPLQPFSQRLQAKLKEYQKALETTTMVLDDSERTAKEFKGDLELLKIALDIDKKKNKK